MALAMEMAIRIRRNYKEQLVALSQQDAQIKGQETVLPMR